MHRVGRMLEKSSYNRGDFPAMQFADWHFVFLFLLLIHVSDQSENRNQILRKIFYGTRRYFVGSGRKDDEDRGGRAE
jgi:hypothetical protein